MSSLYLIVGLGQTGLSFVRYCLRHQLPFAVTDSRDNPPGLTEVKALAPEVRVACGGFDATLFDQAAVLLVSPGISLKTPLLKQAIAQGKPVWGDTELFARHVHVPVIGITGANGKSTVTTLVGEMGKKAGLKTIVAGNIGIPLLDVCEESADLFVLELSSFQLELTTHLPLTAATVLNVTEDHMDRYDNFQEYVAAKQRIYSNTVTAVYNRSDINTRPISQQGQQISFADNGPPTGFDYGTDTKGDLLHGNETLLSEKELPLQGRHHRMNALAALALAEAVNIPQKAAIDALKSFHGLLHRCELVANDRGVTWINDSKATNVGAAAAAIVTLARNKNLILLAGGMGKSADFSLLAPLVAQHVKQLILFGKDKAQIAQACRGSMVQQVDTLESAMRLAKALAEPGDCVLLSPACASFDQFNNFEHRGDVFRSLAKQLIHEPQ